MSRHTFIYIDDSDYNRIHTEYEADEDTWPKVLYEFAKHLGHAYGYDIVQSIKVKGNPLEDEAYKF